MTPTALLTLYTRIWRDTPAPDLHASVVRHMRDILAAPDLDAAYAVVAGWALDEDGARANRRRVARVRRLARGCV